MDHQWIIYPHDRSDQGGACIVRSKHSWGSKQQLNFSQYISSLLWHLGRGGGGGRLGTGHWFIQGKTHICLDWHHSWPCDKSHPWLSLEVEIELEAGFDAGGGAEGGLEGGVEEAGVEGELDAGFDAGGELEGELEGEFEAGGVAEHWVIHGWRQVWLAWHHSKPFARSQPWISTEEDGELEEGGSV